MMRVTQLRTRPGFGAFLRARRLAHELSGEEFAPYFGVKQGAISKYERTDSVPPRRVIEQAVERLSGHGGIDERLDDWLVAAGYEEEASPFPIPRAGGVREVSGAYVPTPSTAWLPVKGVLRAGEVTMAEEAEGELFAVTEEHAKSADWVVKCEGYSMAPNIAPGEFLAVKEGAAPVAGDVVVARQGDSTFVKRFVRRGRNGVLLRSDNPEYDDIEGKDIDIIGVVVWKHTPIASLRKKV